MRLLLLDTCGDTASLALAEHEVVLQERSFGVRTASAELVACLREDLQSRGWPLRSLQSVVVVNGPGSFTGVRVGLAAAKGVCEVAGVALLPCSRLEVLLRASTHQASMAVLDAGRGEFYVRWRERGNERLLGREELLREASGRSIVVAEQKAALSLAELRPEKVSLHARDALPLVAGKACAESDTASVDVNYVRAGQALYAPVSLPLAV